MYKNDAPAVAGDPVAWRYRPSAVWDDYVLTDDPEKAARARGNGLHVEALCLATPQPTQAQAGAVPLTESEMGEGWRKFQETLDDRMAADPAGVRNMGREHWLSWAHWKAACNFARGIKGGQHGESV